MYIAQLSQAKSLRDLACDTPSELLGKFILRELVFVQFGTSGKVPYFLTQVTDSGLAVNGVAMDRKV